MWLSLPTVLKRVLLNLEYYVVLTQYGITLSSMLCSIHAVCWSLWISAPLL